MVRTEQDVHLREQVILMSLLIKDNEEIETLSTTKLIGPRENPAFSL